VLKAALEQQQASTYIRQKKTRNSGTGRPHTPWDIARVSHWTPSRAG